MDERRPDYEEHGWVGPPPPANGDAQAALLEQLGALRESVSALEKQVGRTGREQFKANVLAENQAAQLAAAVEALRAADERREAELAALRERALSAQADARLEVIRSILPALDGLDEALRSGRQVLEQYDQRWQGADARPPAEDTRAAPIGAPARGSSVLGWLRDLLAPPPPEDTPPEAAPAQGAPADTGLRAALDSWLVGLGFVRRRMLDALSAQGVVPMDAEGAPFDPRYHIAVEVAPAAPGRPPGTVVQELRRGYLSGERVMRHAEVAVARDT